MRMRVRATAAVMVSLAAMLKDKNTNQIYNKTQDRDYKQSLMMDLWWLKGSFDGFLHDK